MNSVMTVSSITQEHEVFTAEREVFRDFYWASNKVVMQEFNEEEY